MTTYQFNGLERQETACCDVVLAGQRTSNDKLADVEDQSKQEEIGLQDY